jgi:hypothetical protein
MSSGHAASGSHGPAFCLSLLVDGAMACLALLTATAPDVQHALGLEHHLALVLAEIAIVTEIATCVAPMVYAFTAAFLIGQTVPGCVLCWLA